jgi:hypothetical protein
LNSHTLGQQDDTFMGYSIKVLGHGLIQVGQFSKLDYNASAILSRYSIDPKTGTESFYGTIQNKSVTMIFYEGKEIGIVMEGSINPLSELKFAVYISESDGALKHDALVTFYPSMIVPPIRPVLNL